MLDPGRPLSEPKHPGRPLSELKHPGRPLSEPKMLVEVRMMEMKQRSESDHGPVRALGGMELKQKRTEGTVAFMTEYQVSPDVVKSGGLQASRTFGCVIFCPS